MTVRVMVVDDDFRVAHLHAEIAKRVPEVEVVGLAHTAADAIAMAERERPDLVLLDEYLPDRRGSQILRHLDAAVLMITATDDVAAVRRAVSAGAVNVVLKPFKPPVLAARLHAFVRFWNALDGSGPVDQRAIDKAMALLRVGDEPTSALPKGRSSVTADAIRDVLLAAEDPLTAAEVAEATGVSRPTAQRYLSDLARAGKVDLGLRYGTTGRPEHRYAWRKG